MFHTSPVGTESNSQNRNIDFRIAHRIERGLATFEALPDDALVDVKIVSALLGRSIASIWRDVSQGRLARPLRVGVRSTRWRARDVRIAMRGSDRHE